MTDQARTPYFARMQGALRAAGIAQPTLVIDRARLDANIDLLKAHLPAAMGLRIVVKSLPSLALVGHVRARTGTDRLMTFNAAMVETSAREMPETDQLLGKPLPAAAADKVLRALATTRRETVERVQWLVDTPRRLRQYEALGEAHGLDLSIALELDVGLHRGGFRPGDALAEALETLHASQRLRLSGLMGYEPHVAKLPADTGWQGAALEGAWRIYRDCMAAVDTVFGAGTAERLTRNAAGSPTYRLYQCDTIANEVSAGSVLVKPTDFDTPQLADHVAASFIATPVLKVWDGVHLPGLEFRPDAPPPVPEPGTSVFIHGGNWLAEPEDPPGLATHKMFGRSSNQELLTAPPGLGLSPDDFVFLRPRQSEAVFLSFGDVAVYEDGRITGHWPVLPASA